MEAWLAAIAGALQGLLEWLPVSSSGQLTLLLAHALGLPPGEAYRASIAAHAGTAASGAILARREVADALRGGPWLRVALIPLVAGAPIGLLVYRLVSHAAPGVLEASTGILLLATAIVVYAARGGGGRSAASLSTLELTVLGMLQGLAALPGLSRSGVVIAYLLYRRVSPPEAVKASLVTGAASTGAYAAYQLLLGEPAGLTPAATAAMGLAALAAGLAGGAFMLGLAERLRASSAAFAAVTGAIALAASLPSLIG